VAWLWSRVGVSLVRHDAEGYLPRSPHKSCLGRRPKANAAENGGGIPTEPLPQLGRLSASAADLLWPWRHQRCFQWSQWRRLRSSARSRGSSAASSSRPLAVRHVAERQRGATMWLALEAARSCPRVHGCRTQVLVAAGYVELGPRLKGSNLEYVILQGSQFHRTKWQRVLQRCSRRPGLVPRWTGWRLLLCSNDYFLNVAEV
jgi:hypothetical protein